MHLGMAGSGAVGRYGAAVKFEQAPIAAEQGGANGGGPGVEDEEDIW